MPRQVGDTVRTVTPLIPAGPDDPICLQFSYDMYGRDMGFLNVYAVVSLVHETVWPSKPLVYLYGSEIENSHTASNDSDIS